MNPVPHIFGFLDPKSGSWSGKEKKITFSFSDKKCLGKGCLFLVYFDVFRRENMYRIYKLEPMHKDLDWGGGCLGSRRLCLPPPCTFFVSVPGDPDPSLSDSDPSFFFFFFFFFAFFTKSFNSSWEPGLPILTKCFEKLKSKAEFGVWNDIKMFRKKINYRMSLRKPVLGNHSRNYGSIFSLFVPKMRGRQRFAFSCM